ncbi:hypothetical protein [Tenacibaculum piscium]|uniref:hypothetical protein n=1 Tax=Tenacibaculum piscium TaxID=1458515 RepID=UPI001EFB0D13|nr:hypothetical protein [Tenacibaculum piscium]MCG8184073.1 hypothetical protein [Tenacibaculum piscium]MCG8205466.1 hypothetical protein [Tenacibaculum piscium]
MKQKTTQHKYTLLIICVLLSSFQATAQFNKFFKKAKEKIQNVNKNNTQNLQTTPKQVTQIPSPVESSNADKFQDNQIYLLNRTKYLKIPTFKSDFSDAKHLSGTYYLSQYFVRNPSSHFDSNPGDIYEAFSIEYHPKTYEMTIHFSENQKRYAVVPEQYRKSADKGNIFFQAGMGGGPDWTNTKFLKLEDGVLLIGAEVYHKNKTEGHQWMNNAKPKMFVIASKNPEKIKKYYKNVALTEKTTFQLFEELRKDAQGEALTKVKMPAKGSLHTSLIGIATKGLNAYFAKTSMKNIKQYITSNRWATVKHKVTGIPLYQWAVGAVIQKNKDGECMLHQFILRKDYTGGGRYGKPYFNGISRTTGVPYGSYCKCNAE